ncbi:MAG: ATP-binding protein [Thermodesulfobacteriota bacterium]
MGPLTRRSRSSSEQVRTTYRIAPFFLVGSLIFSAIFALVQRDAVSHRVLTIWFCSNLLVTAVRFSLAYYYKSASAKSLEIVRWERLHIAGVILSGIVWGSAGIFLYPPGSLAHQVFLGFALGLIVAATMSSYVSTPEVSYSFAPIVLAPITARFFAHGSDTYIGMGLVSLLFTSVVLINARNMTIVNAVSSRLRGEIQERIQTEKKLDEEETKFQTVLENAPVGIVVTDENGSLKYINPAFQKLFGYDLKEIPRGRIWFRKAYPDPTYRHHVISTWKNDVHGFKSGETAFRIFTATCKDSKEKVIQFLAAPVGGGDTLTVCEDITERQQAESMLLENEKRFHDLVETSLTAIAIVQEEQVIYYNSEAERLLGPFQDNYRFSRFPNVLADDLEKARDFYDRTLSHEDSQEETTLRFLPPAKEGKAQKIHWVFCRASRIQYLRKEAILMNMMDITRTMELETQAIMNDKMTSLGRITTGIVHELRNPLSGINVYLSTLRKQMRGSLNHQSPEEDNILENILEKLQSASNSIESVIKRVMDFAKPGLSKLVLTDLNQTIEEAISLCSVTLRKKEIQLEKHLQEPMSRCYTDPRLIQQVILNLITNASQALEPIKGEKRIALKSWHEEGWTCLSVSDSGPGIPPTLRTKIFDPFFTTKEEGMGIGLSLCQRIIEDHGGLLIVATSSWGGAEFRIKIPIEKRGKGK